MNYIIKELAILNDPEESEDCDFLSMATESAKVEKQYIIDKLGENYSKKQINAFIKLKCPIQHCRGTEQFSLFEYKSLDNKKYVKTYRCLNCFIDYFVFSEADDKQINKKDDTKNIVPTIDKRQPIC